MNETPKPSKHSKMSQKTKFAVEQGPLIAMFIGFFWAARIGPYLDSLLGISFFANDGHKMYVALFLFLVTFACAFAFSIWKERRIDPTMMVTGAIVTVLGGLTFLFQNKTFIYIKPTITYLFFAGVLAGGLWMQKIFLKFILGAHVKMPDQAWRTLTWRFVTLFVVLAIANEVAWRSLTSDCVPDANCPGEGIWLNIKLFGFFGAFCIFILTQAPFISKQVALSDEDR